MPISKNEIGNTYGRLLVIEKVGTTKKHGFMYKCVCSCGNMATVRGACLRSGNTKSCGCLVKEQNKVNPHNHKHGLSYQHLYRLWARIKTRCFNKSQPQYNDYGGRGITMYSAWINNATEFCDYINKTLGPRPTNHSLDRIDNNQGYLPGNLRWATRQQQNENRRKPYTTHTETNSGTY